MEPRIFCKCLIGNLLLTSKGLVIELVGKLLIISVIPIILGANGAEDFL